MTEPFSAKDFLLIEAADDMVELRLVAQHVADVLRTDDVERIRERTLAIVQELMESELIFAGTLNVATGALERWDSSGTSIVLRIKREWASLSAPLGLYEVACFRATERGKEAAQRLREAAAR